MKVILSIKPEFINKIISGEKKFEYRRKIFKKDVESVVVYATSPVKLIVGEFNIEEIIYNDLDVLWKETHKKSGITKKFFYEYFNALEKGYAIKIKQFYHYKTYKRLEDYGILMPPQSFVYYCKHQNLITKKSASNREIDRLVYELYGLTEEEVGIIENNK